MSRKILCVFPLMIAALLLVGCQHGAERINGNDITGIYYLVNVDGSAVPATVFHDGVALQTLSGTFIISDDGTCFSRTRFIPPDGNEMTREVYAKYQVQESRLIIQWEGAGVTEGTVEGDAFVMDNHGMIFEYTRSP